MLHKHRGGIERSLGPRTRPRNCQQRPLRLILKLVCRETHQVRIPHPYCTPNTNFPHKQAVHPAKAELHIFHTLGLEMLGKTSIDSSCQVAEGAHLSMDAGLSVDVVVLNSIQEICQAPESVGLH